jgi:hypothetical protein
MVRRSLLVVLVGSIVIALAVGCGSDDASSKAIKVVHDFYAAINGKRLDKAIKYVDERAVFVDPNGTFRGAEEVRTELIQRWAFVTFEHTNFRSKGGRVVYDFKVRDAYGRVIAKGTDGLTIVENGKIIFDGNERTERDR